MNIIYILGALFAFSLLVIVHEFGHFMMAKLNGVKVEEFSIGMGPKLFGVRRGETEYSIKLLPIGGYVKMLGEDGEVTSDERAFQNKSPLRKLSVVSAGPIMNIILAVILYSIIAGSRGFLVPVVDNVVPGNPADLAGIRKGDKIIQVNEKAITTWEDFVTQVYNANGSTISVIYKRGEETKSSTITPVKDEKENRFVVGVYPTLVENPGVNESIKYGFIETTSLVKQTFGFFKTLFTGGASVDDFGGPVTIMRVSGEAAKAGFLSLLSFAAYLSVQLAIFNIIPFPALDGGWIILFLIEFITRKKIDSNKVGVLNYIGFVILITLMIVVTIKDILYPVKF